jgi:hypothetical protein
LQKQSHPDAHVSYAASSHSKRFIARVFGAFGERVVTPLSVVDLPESYKDALAGVTGTFQASFQPISSRLEAFGKVFQPTTLNGGTTGERNA